MSDDFAIEVYTPKGKALEGRSDAVKLPTENGEIGILNRHRKYVGILGLGVMQYFCKEEDQAKRAVITGGFCSFSGDRLLILADAIDLPETVDRDDYASERQELSDFIKSGNMDDEDRVLAGKKLARIEAIDTLISH